jgi:NTP pyrophosphatase (non-canonical NTP hydrolase)
MKSGFYDDAARNDMAMYLTMKIALVITELAEAIEEVREGNMGLYYSGDKKPEGFGVELADAIIRIADLAEHTGVDLSLMIGEKMAYNATRPYMHGKAI